MYFTAYSRFAAGGLGDPPLGIGIRLVVGNRKRRDKERLARAGQLAAFLDGPRKESSSHTPQIVVKVGWAKCFCSMKRSYPLRTA